MNENWKPVEPWIRRVLARHGWTPTDWCRLAGLSPSTLTRPLNDPGYALSPSLATLRALAAVTPVPLSLDALSAPVPRAPVAPMVTARETQDAHVFRFEVHIPK